MKNTFFIAESPFLLLLMPLLAGISLSMLFSFAGMLQLLLACILTITLFFLILNWKYTEWKIYRKAWIGGVFIYLFLFLFGVLIAEKNKEINNNNHFYKHKATALLVTIVQEPKQTGNIVRFNTLVTHTSFNGKISVSSGNLLVALKLDFLKKVHFNYGDKLLIRNQYKLVDGPFNPAEFNYKLWLQHQNIYYQTFLNPNQ
jgi:competence protein ComEC